MIKTLLEMNIIKAFKAHLEYANMLIREMKGVEAKKHFEKALHLDANFAETYDTYAFALYQSLSDTLKAKQYYEKAIELAPKTVQYRSDYAKFLCSLKDTLNAKNQYRKAVELAPNNANVHYNYGYFLINYTNNKKEARKQYLEAVKIDSNYKSQASSFGFHSK
jgi:Tfp pilus assembly protein PilF